MSEQSSNDLVFADDPTTDKPLQEPVPAQPWLVLIVDDEPDVHQITRLSLSKFSYKGRALKFFHAYTGQEAKHLISEHADVAVILLDVVMEEDDSGLQVAQYIRETLNNQFVRIILRTGQPGFAPESEVIRKYDIDDYKEKTELTKLKLTTAIYSSLRIFNVIRALEQGRDGLEKVIQATSTIFKINSLDKFLSGLMMQISSLANPNGDGILAVISQGQANQRIDEARVMVGTGHLQQAVDKSLADVLDEASVLTIKEAIGTDRHIQGKTGYAFVLPQKRHQSETYFIFIRTMQPMEDTHRHLVDLFCSNACLAYDNVSLYQEIEDTQREMIFTLGAVAEFRSRETSNHVRRVAEYSKVLALKIGLDKPEAELICLASPMHDIGKLGIPDVILQKKGRLTETEFEVIKTHSDIGYEMLNSSDRPIFKAAAIIAREHQEKWNGKGYPRALSGEGIHIYGRITAIADVFDALASERCYKKAWPMDKVKRYFEEEVGQHFDPTMAQLFLDDFDTFVAIKERFKDEVG